MRPSNDGRCCRHCSARPAPASTTSSATTTTSFVFFFYSSCIYLLHLTSNQNSSALLSSFIRHTSIPFFHSFRALSEASVSATVAPRHRRRPPPASKTVSLHHWLFTGTPFTAGARVHCVWYVCVWHESAIYYSKLNHINTCKKLIKHLPITLSAVCCLLSVSVSVVCASTTTCLFVARPRVVEFPWS